MEPTVFGASETLGHKEVSDHFELATHCPRQFSNPVSRAVVPRLFSRDFFSNVDHVQTVSF